jgi:hypothetical protein
MFAKIYTQIFDSSIADDYRVRHVFEDLLKLADMTGAVDMTVEAIARRTNVPFEEVQRGIERLCEPDPNSRSRAQEGRRLVSLDSNRTYGWLIVNYTHYRNLRDEEARRSYFRDAMRKYRQKHKKKSTDVQADADAGGESVLKVVKPTLNTSERIYAAYPRKVGKPRALMVIARMLQKYGADFLLSKTEEFSKTQIPGDQFTPYPSTWFQQERFNDAPETWIHQNGKQVKPPTARELELERRMEAARERRK